MEMDLKMRPKIKIVYVVCRMVYGGVESVILNYSKKMDAQKFEFHIITQDLNDHKCIKDFVDNGFIVHTITHKRKSLFKNIFEIFAILKKEKFDIVHSQMTLTNFYVLFIAKILNIKIRLSHSHNYFCTSNHIKKIIYHSLAIINQIVATDYLACGIDAASFLFGKKNVENGKVFILNNAIKLGEYAFDQSVRERIRMEYSLEDTFCIGHVGRFMNQKNHTFLIDVFNEVYKKLPQSRLLLIGDGDLIENIRNKVKKLGLEKYVIFTGNIKNVNEMYQVMDVLVLPSLYEGLPVVLIEAQASGLKCIVSNKVDERSALTDQVEFIPLNDYKNWAEIITKNIDKHHAENRRINNRTILEEKGYSIEIEAKKLENYYLSKIQ